MLQRVKTQLKISSRKAFNKDVKELTLQQTTSTLVVYNWVHLLIVYLT